MENYQKDERRHRGELFETRVLEHCTEYLLPLFDRHGDQLALYVEKTDDALLITDDGYWQTELQLAGMEPSDKLMNAVRNICSPVRIIVDGNELKMRSTAPTLQNDLYLFGQILLQITDHDWLLEQL